MYRVWGLLVNYLQVALPLVAANKLQVLGTILAQKPVEPERCFGGSILKMATVEKG